MSKTALVVEGGGMRGVFTAGVLDTFLEKNYDPFDLFIGCSAGTLNISAFMAREKKYSLRLIQRLIDSETFIDWSRFLKGGNAMELEELYHILSEQEPIDIHRASANLQSRPFVITSCNKHHGTADYHIAELQHWYKQLIASCAIPIIHREGVKLGNDFHIDGALADPIPVQKAIAMGANDIVVIRTRTTSWVEKQTWLEKVLGLWVRNDEVVSELLDNYSKQYNDTCAFMKAPPAGINITEIAPAEELKTAMLTRQIDTLEADYSAGIKAAEYYFKEDSLLKDRVMSNVC